MPLNDSILELLANYLQKERSKLLKPTFLSDYLFPNQVGKPITRQGYFKIIKRQAEQSNIKKVISPHTLRHSFATCLINNDIDLRSVQTLLGHVDISTTQIYTHVTLDKNKKEYLATHPLAKGVKLTK